METKQLKKYYGSILLFASVLAGLWAVSEYHYLLFHSVAEIFSIVVACSIFVLAWNSRRFADNTYLPFIGIAYLFVAGLDLLHTLAYKGMGIFAGYGSNLAAQLWISARYMEGASLLLAIFLIGRPLRAKLTLAGYAAFTALLLASIFYWDIFPTCFVEGSGLTAFKKISEYIICFLLLASIAMLIKRRRAFEPHILQLLVASMAVTIASELAFTLYVNVEGFANLIGHYFKIISFYLVYKAIIQTGLTKPFALLLRDLKKNEEALKAAKENLEIEVDARTAELRQTQEKLESRVHERTAELEQAKEKLEQEIIERKEAEEKFRNLAEQSPDMIFIIREGKFAYVNQRCEEILGYKKEEFYCPDFDYLTTIAPESRSLKEANFRKHLNGEEVLPVEYCFLTKSGGIVNAIATTKLIDYEGQRAILATATDITGRKQAEAALRQSEHLLARSQEIAHLGSWELDLVNDRLSWSDEVYRIFGLQPQEFGATYEAFLERVHPDDRAMVDEAYSGSIREGKNSYEIEHRVVKKLTGEIRYVHEKCEHFRDDSGKIIRSVGMVHDITKRKQAEEALRRSEQELAIRNKIAQIFLTIPDEQIYSEVLQVILEALESKHGVFGYINEDGAFVCPSLTRDIWDQCQMAEKDYVFPRQMWGGIWGKAMIEKKTLCSNAPFAVPVGHIPVRRALDVPLIYQRKLIGNLLVGNKPTDYNEKDRQLLETIADYIAPILGARLEKDRWERQREEASEALQRARDELEIRVQERTSELAKSREALWRLAGRLLSVQEEERRRLSRELHDDLTQRLAVLAIDAGKLEQQVGATRGKLRDKLRQMKEQMIKLSADVHDLSRQLHPSIIDDLGLRQAIQSECANFTKREGILIRYEPKAIPPKIPRDVSICLFRIVQEGLRNIARHAKVEEAQVRLIGDDKKIVLTIEDSGIGFDPAQARGEAGLGLVSMEERVRLIRGELCVKSKPGVGTVIYVTAPLQGEWE